MSTEAPAAPLTRSDRLRHEIMLTMKANRVPVTGDVWFALVFRTESELVKIAQSLHINTRDIK